MAMHTKMVTWLGRHTILCFLLMSFSFIFFGLFPLDLLRVFSANADYISGNGISGLMDGGLQQLLELCLGAIGAMFCYLVFKICEHILVHKHAYAEKNEK